MDLEANLAFGDVAVGQTSERILRIYNRGTATLNVTGMTGPSGYSSTWTSGAIAAGTSQAATITFTPTEGRTYNGTLTVNGDQTACTNTMAISGNGTRQTWSRTGVGDAVFDMPTYVSRVRIYRHLQRPEFELHRPIGGRATVNEIIGTSTPFTIGVRYQGDHLVTGGVTQITNSSNVQWSFEELR
jgi:hypothetical protein